MDIIIRNSDNQPIYEQIYTQIKRAIITSQIEEGDALPSIRSLAKDLRISVITTKRAYEELERNGYVHSVAGKGFFVAPKDEERIKETHLSQIKEHMERISQLSSACQMEQAELIALFQTILSKEE